MKFSIRKFCDEDNPSAFLSMEDRESLLSSLKLPESIAGARCIETDEEVRSLPKDSVIDLLSLGMALDTPRICNAATSTVAF